LLTFKVCLTCGTLNIQQGLLMRAMQGSYPAQAREFTLPQSALTRFAEQYQHLRERLHELQQREASADVQAQKSLYPTETLASSSSGSCQALTLPVLSAGLQHTQQQQLLLHSAKGESAPSDGLQLQQYAVPVSATTATATTAAAAASTTTAPQADSATGTGVAAESRATAASNVLSASLSEQRTAQQSQQAQSMAVLGSSGDTTAEALALNTLAGGSSSAAAAAAAADTSTAVAATAATTSSSSAVSSDDVAWRDEETQAQLTQFKQSFHSQFYTEKDRTHFANSVLLDWVAERHGDLPEKLAKLKLWCQQGHVSSDDREALAQRCWLVYLQQRVMSDRQTAAHIMIDLACNGGDAELQQPDTNDSQHSDTAAVGGGTVAVASATVSTVASSAAAAVVLAHSSDASPVAPAAATGTATASGVLLHKFDDRLIEDLYDLQELTDAGHWSEDFRVVQFVAAVRQYTRVRLASTEAALQTKVVVLQMCGDDELVSMQVIEEQIDLASSKQAAHTAADAAATAAAVAAAAATTIEASQ
jgi:hypothetical protein